MLLYLLMISNVWWFTFSSCMQQLPLQHNSEVSKVLGDGGSHISDLSLRNASEVLLNKRAHAIPMHAFELFLRATVRSTVQQV